MKKAMVSFAIGRGAGGLGAFLLLMVLSGVAAGQSSQPAVPQAPAPAAAVAAPATAPSPEGGAVPQEPKQPDEMEGLRDPFLTFLPIKVAAVAQEETVVEEKVFDASSLIVTGLVWGTDRPQAIINGKIMNKGEMVRVGEGEGEMVAEITDISREGITLRYGNRDYLLKRPGPVPGPPPS